jgi:hypothetical protein
MQRSLIREQPSFRRIRREAVFLFQASHPQANTFRRRSERRFYRSYFIRIRATEQRSNFHGAIQHGSLTPRQIWPRVYHWRRDSPKSEPHGPHRHRPCGEVRRAQEAARSGRSGNCRNPQTGPKRAEPKATTAASTIIARRTGKNDNEKCVRKHAAVR